MTDREALMELIKRFRLEPGGSPEAYPSEVMLEAGHGGVQGYGIANAYIRFEFNPDGSFLTAEIGV